MITLDKKIETGQALGLYDILVELQASIATLTAADVVLTDADTALGVARGVCDATIVVGSAHTDTIAATIQLKDYAGADMAVSCSVIAYLSDDAAGLDACATSPTTDLANGTDGECEILLAEHVYLLTSETDGDIDVTLGYTTGAHDFYLVVVLPNGKKIVSTKFEFTA